MVEALIHLRMLTEATLDFPEEDIDFLEAADAAGQLALIRQQLAEVLNTARQGALLREGCTSLVGQPNVGKSSLDECLGGRQHRHRHRHCWHNRDTVREEVLIDGVPMHVIDTAGLRETEDVVEQMGIERTRVAIQRADLVLLLLDARQGLTTADHLIWRSSRLIAASCCG